MYCTLIKSFRVEINVQLWILKIYSIKEINIFLNVKYHSEDYFYKILDGRRHENYAVLLGVGQETNAIIMVQLMAKPVQDFGDKRKICGSEIFARYETRIS